VKAERLWKTLPVRIKSYWELWLVWVEPPQSVHSLPLLQTETITRETVPIPADKMNPGTRSCFHHKANKQITEKQICDVLQTGSTVIYNSPWKVTLVPQSKITNNTEHKFG
jgi:hypothetical protein